jgi:hypothetical protein
MDEYCSKMTEHISKITERYIKMAYSKYKMIEYHDDGGLDAAARGIGGLVNTGSAIGRCGIKARHVWAHGSVGSVRVRESVGHARAQGQRCTVGSARDALVGSVCWLAGLADESIGPSA